MSRYDDLDREALIRLIEWTSGASMFIALGALHDLESARSLVRAGTH